jgi:DNA-directed RNA polymerase specialized sigma24 family protein
MEVARKWSIGIFSHMENELPIYREQPRPAAFETLLLKLDPQRDRAAEKYEGLRRRLVKFFEWSSCFPAEDLADETLDRLARILANRPVRVLEAFLWGVAKKIRQESHKRAERIIGIADLPDHGISLQDAANVEDEVNARRESELRSRRLRMCLQRIAGHDRKVFLKYHSFPSGSKEHRERLAAELGLTIGALRVRINRMRSQLEKCVQQRLTYSSGKANGPHRPAGYK